MGDYDAIGALRKAIAFAAPQPTEWQRIGDEINAAMIFARANFVNVM